MALPQARHCIQIIKEGVLDEGECTASSPVVLVRGQHNVVVGTGLPGDRDRVLAGLREHEVAPEDVEYVVCTHGAVENVGNLNLFPCATHIVGYDIVRDQRRILHDFSQDIPYEINDDIEVIPTPGHKDGGVVSVLVTNSPIGSVAIASGVFHSEDDLETPDLWVGESSDAETQQQSRITLLRLADHVVPRYGTFYRIPETYRGSGVPVVQTP